MRDYLVIYEKGPTSWGAYVPDLPGCFAVGKTRKETGRLIREAIREHIEVLRAEGLPVPEPNQSSGRVAVA